MTRKIALLIGVSDYASGLPSLPGAVRDAEAMRKVLRDAEMGGFDDATVLMNPDRQTMEQSIETLFADLAWDDLALLFFSGHGIKDDSGNLYLATRITEKNARGQLTKSTAVSASFIHDIMDSSRSRRQVVILDCCFSGAFAEGMKAKDDGFVDVGKEFGGEGRAVLTSSTSTQYSFEQDNFDLSIYTYHLIEGIETGAADLDRDEWISVEELHKYAKTKVQETAPTMKPEIYAVKEGYSIHLSKVPANDPKLRYRREVEQWITNSEITAIGRTILENLRFELGLTFEEAATIEAKALQPYRDYQKKLWQYEVELLGEVRLRGLPLSEDTQRALKQLQRSLQLKDEDVTAIEKLLLGQEGKRQSIFRSIPLRTLVLVGVTSMAIGVAVLIGLPDATGKKSGIVSYEPLKIIPKQLNEEECKWLKEQYEQNNRAVKQEVGATHSAIRTRCENLDVVIGIN